MHTTTNDLKKLRSIATNMFNPIQCAYLHNNNAMAKELGTAQLILLKLAQHLEEAFFNTTNLQQLDADISFLLKDSQ